MDPLELYDAPGHSVIPATLAVPKAHELADLLRRGIIPFVRFVECRRLGGSEVVVLDIEPEVPQHPVHDVRPVERIAVMFDEADVRQPNPLALRKDFPLVPHVNLGQEGDPRSLCLYDISYADQKLRWTAARLVRQLHRWLSLTARGELHEADQPLEQFFAGSLSRIVLPSAFYGKLETGIPERLAVWPIPGAHGVETLIAVADGDVAPTRGVSGIEFVGVVFNARPRTHGVLRVQPQTLSELHDYLAEADEDLLDTLRTRLRAWMAEGVRLDASLIILLRIPKQREESGPVELAEVWAFATTKSVLEVGVEVGVWGIQDGEPGLLLFVDHVRRGQGVPLHLLNPTPALTPERAAALNGVPPSDAQYVAVGLGALGSQLVSNMIRAGQGRWTLVDEDLLLPHNVSRHHLPGAIVGFPKAESMASLVNTFFEQHVAAFVVADVLSEAPADLLKAYEQADVLLDLSASVTVARFLALDLGGHARRLSLFLSPDGNDLVLLAEPADRSLRLDQLEMEYYRRLVQDDALATHLLRSGQPIRYAHTCRDVSAELAQELVALHAAVGARAVRTTIAGPEAAAVSLWRASDELGVTILRAEARQHEEFTVGDWTVSVAAPTLSEISEQRAGRLPNETGGVLIGHFDTQRRRVYVVDHIPSPPDSEEWPTAYVRGMKGLPEMLAEIEVRTASQLEYVGEWHSHPAGADTWPSDDDRVLFSWLAEHRSQDGLPAVMVIAGDHGRSRWFVGTCTAGTDVPATTGME